MTPDEAQREDALRASWNRILAQSNNAARTNDSETIAKLGSIVLTGAHWNGTDIHAVAKDLETRSVESDPAHRGVHFSVVLPIEGGSDKLGREINPHVYVIISSRRVLRDLLYSICAQTNLCYKVEKDHVTLLPWQPDSFIAPPTWLYME